MRRVPTLATMLLIGLVCGFLIAGFRTTSIAQSVSLSDNNEAMLLGNHHTEIRFSLSPGDSQKIVVPKNSFPVRVEFLANGAHTTIMGIKRWFMVYDRNRNVTEYLDAGSANSYVLASPDSPSPPPLRIDFACAELSINLGGTMTITRIPAQAGSDCTNSSGAVSYAVSMWY